MTTRGHVLRQYQEIDENFWNLEELLRRLGQELHLYSDRTISEQVENVRENLFKVHREFEKI